MKIDSIIRHAITPPAFEQIKLHRESLVDLLHSNVPKKIIILAAPPGYGKTTLLADFTQNTELPICWVRLTDADRDVMRLATVLAASLQRRFRRLRNEPNLESLASASSEALARAFARVIDERVSEAFVIVFDDVHIINRTKEVLSFFDAWLEVQPEQVTLIASGREVLEVSLAKLMADGDLAGMGPQDLALTRDELLRLAKRQMGVELSDYEAEQLMQETRGWVTGVLLSGILSRNVMSALAQTGGPLVYEYLASVILNRQPDDVRRFMLDSAVLPIMTAEACDYVLRRDTSNRLLARLVKEGIFVIASIESPKTYEYHPQFREFLLDVLSNVDEVRLRNLRMRAASYLARYGNPEHAVELYIEAKAEPYAGRLAEKHAAQMFRTGRIQTLERWAQRLENSSVRVPKLFLYLSKGQTDKGDLENAQRTLDKARSMLAEGKASSLRAEVECQQAIIAFRREAYEELVRYSQSAQDALPQGASRQIKALCLRVQAMALGYGSKDYHAAEQMASQSVRLFEKCEDLYGLATALVDLSWYQSALGEALRAHLTNVRAHRILEEIGSPLPLATSYNNLAIDAHHQGRYEEALKLFNHAIRSARQAGSPAREAMILFGQADLFNDLGLALQAAELYGQGLRLASEMNNRRLIRYGCVQTSVLHRRRGSGDLPHQWLSRAIALGGEEMASPDISIQMSALEIATSQEHALKELEKMRLNTHAALDANQKSLVLHFLAKALVMGDQAQKAERVLKDLLDSCGLHGTEQIIAAELACDKDFREFIRSHLLGHAMVSTILHRVETIHSLAQQYQGGGEEQPQVLKLLANALGRMDISLGSKPLSELKPLAREVLLFLIDNRRVDRDMLLEVFWPYFPPGRQVSNLYTAIYSLRRALGKDAVTLDGSVYGISADLPMEYDVARFERAATIAEGLPPGDPRRFFALTETINSYGGRFLPESTSEWAVERGRELEFRFLELLTAHAEEALIRNQPSRALSSLRRALAIDPYRDDINLRYLETLGLLERRSEIVAHYQLYMQLLANELGLDPPETVRELYTKLIG